MVGIYLVVVIAAVLMSVLLLFVDMVGSTINTVIEVINGDR